MIKKTLMLAAVIGMLFTANTVFGATIDITVGSKTGYPRDTSIEVPITVSDVTGLGVISADINLTYDSTRLTYVSTSLSGTIIDSWNRSVNGATPGLVRVALFTPDYPCSGNGNLIKFYFNVQSTAASGSSPLVLTKAQLSPASNISTIHNGTFTVLSVNRPPVLEPIGNKQVNECSGLIFNITASDPDLDPLTYSASNLPFGATFNASTHAFSWYPNCTQAGTYTVHFAVLDGRGGTDSQDITIIVKDNNTGYGCSNTGYGCDCSNTGYGCLYAR